MMFQRVLDDGQTQTGAAGGARTPGIHAVKALGQARNMFCRYTHAGIGDRQMRFTLCIDPPADADLAVIGCVLDGVLYRTRLMPSFAFTSSPSKPAGDSMDSKTCGCRGRAVTSLLSMASRPATSMVS